MMSPHLPLSRIRRRSPAALLVLPLLTIQGAPRAEELVPFPLPRPAHFSAAPHFVDVPLPRRRPALIGTSISLADAIFLGLRNNRAIKSAYIDRIAQKFDLRVAEDRFTPQFGISGTASRQLIGDAETTNIDISPGVSVLTQTGAKFNFAWSNVAAIGDRSQTLTSVAEISLEQPLFRSAGSEVNLAPVQSARLGELVNQLRLKATVSETVGAIIFAHRDLLLAQEELKLAEAAVERGGDLLHINQTLIDSGRMAQMDAVQTEADLENQKLRVLRARQQVESTRLALLDLLALDLETKIVATETLAPREVAMNTDMLLGIALAQRPDYQGQLYAIKQSRLGLVVAENAQLWDISLFARGRFGTQFTSGYESQDIADLTAGLTFTIPINDLSSQQQVVQASTTQQSAELQLGVIRSGIEMQVRGSASEVTVLWQQIGVAQKSLELARQAVDIEKLKLNAGRSTTFQVQSLETNLRNAEVQLLGARIGYLNALTRLDLQLGTTLDTWQIALQE